MALLQDYLNTVRLYLPSEADQQDILTELAAHLQIKLDEREEELGRALTLEEETAVLWGYGHPVAVAARYGRANLGLSFGRELIGPEYFILYRRILLAQWSIALVVVTIVNAAGAGGGSLLGRYLWPMTLQFVLTTTIFVIVEQCKRRWPPSGTWSFPPPHLQAIPRWQSVSGFVTLSLAALWWAAVPFAPALLLGRADGRVVFTDNFHQFYWPLLLPALAGAAQRLVTFVEPRWSLLQTVTRLVTNSWSLIVVVQFAMSHPYVAPASVAFEPLARGVNNTMWWNMLATFGTYWLVNASFMAYLLAKHVASLRRQRRDHALQQAQ